MLRVRSAFVPVDVGQIVARQSRLEVERSALTRTPLSKVVSQPSGLAGNTRFADRSGDLGGTTATRTPGWTAPRTLSR
jgi:hypothetical protein